MSGRGWPNIGLNYPDAHGKYRGQFRSHCETDKRTHLGASLQQGIEMFWLRHPQPVTPRKAVAELTVTSTSEAALNTRTIVVEKVEGAATDGEGQPDKEP